MDHEQGYRLNVGIILMNAKGQLLFAKRFGIRNAWQFPQGGIHDGEAAEEAMYRELNEELGLPQDAVEIVAESAQWLKYELPARFIRHHEIPLVIGQKQKWFLLRLASDEEAVVLDRAEKPEFDEWKWVDYWYPAKHVVDFKREVYQKILEEFAPLIASS
jgi:putative (di)nucleoside polyphosphate hydrolase